MDKTTARGEEIDTSVAHPARRYDYWLGGKDNFAVDRASGEAVAREFPTISTAARANRAFLGRAVTYLASQAGVRQFLDIGTGLPTANNTHEVAQAVAPDARIAYVDNDPMVMVHARALLTSTPQGRTGYFQADLRDPDAILSNPGLREVLDLDQPVALLLVAILHFIADSDDPIGLVRHYLDALPAGSYLVVSHATGDHMDPDQADKITDALTRGGGSFQLRSHDDVARFFTGLELVPPGLVSVVEWHPAADAPEGQLTVKEVSMWAGIARHS
ncbi:SAM-dependent methyltransferase [Cryptosporangium phraense]|uniref:SAM-dependent methyltransferase n=1 Tax=Cryptosporangium phraense TaxID=2593070 RepID=A0A545ANI8_9ACTN|nr:SAM-dependent methyltransferase [Cryptosporangium phraense]